MRSALLGMAFLSASVGAGCAWQPGCTHGTEPMVNELLYFGASTPVGVVSPQQWNEFIAAVVTPRFPSGLTVWTGDGQWRSRDGSIVAETSRLLNLLRRPGLEYERPLHEIINGYKSQFQQEAVLRVTSTACVAFE